MDNKIIATNSEHGYSMYKDNINHAWHLCYSGKYITRFNFGELSTDCLNQLYAFCKSSEEFITYMKATCEYYQYEESKNNEESKGKSKNKDKSKSEDEPPVSIYRFLALSESLYPIIPKTDAAALDRIAHAASDYFFLKDLLKDDICSFFENLKIFLGKITDTKRIELIASLYQSAYAIMYELAQLPIYFQTMALQLHEDYNYKKADKSMHVSTTHEFPYFGVQDISLPDEKIPCEKYKFSHLAYMLAEDFLMLLYSNAKNKLKMCSCGYIYIVTPNHKNRKTCPCCRQSKLTSQADKNKPDCNPRTLHKNILDYIRNVLKGNPEDFRLESNYYWDVIQGRNPATPKGKSYSDNITTEAMYLDWLKEQHEKQKKNCSDNHTDKMIKLVADVLKNNNSLLSSNSTGLL